MRISHSVIPNGGWCFLEGKVLLIAETFDLLVKNLQSHRLHNGIPPGDPVAEIEEYLCKKHPQMERKHVLA